MALTGSTHNHLRRAFYVFTATLLVLAYTTSGVYASQALASDRVLSVPPGSGRNAYSAEVERAPESRHTLEPAGNASERHVAMPESFEGQLPQRFRDPVWRRLAQADNTVLWNRGE